MIGAGKAADELVSAVKELKTLKAAEVAENICTGPKCFVAGTRIKTADGEKKIEEIEPGDEVWAYDEYTGKSACKKVTRTFVNETDTLVHVTVAGETIRTTPTHPFYVEEKGFIRAENLKAGGNLLLINGETAKVDAIEIEQLEAPVKVYNFEVEDHHTYYVSEQGVLVHNVCPGKTTSPYQMQKQVEAGKAPKGGVIDLECFARKLTANHTKKEIKDY